MMEKRLGKQTVKFSKAVSLLSTAAVAGQKEGEGPLASHFDIIMENSEWGEDTWEKAESKMQRMAVGRALEKAKVDAKDVKYIFAGDLLNQCISSTFGLMAFDIPFLGVYGACSTMAETMGLAAMSIDGGYGDLSVAVTSSHFCTAERQYRNPLEYGGQRTPTAQWTVTGSGAVVLSESGNGPYITHFTSGKVVDLGVKDANNMGAAMAPAAADTLAAHFEDTGRNPDFYDLIVTGDLGTVGKSIIVDLMREKGFDVGGNYDDCGCMIFDVQKQDMHAGGSGCGCGAITLCGYIMDRIRAGELKNVLFMGTGALLSPTSTLQGESIPSVAHAVAISAERE
ncbi:MAG: stage V sporulation protein AD [Clostridia bacterium]|nr:stage V sporulation protein AD [Clostridia bacterium]